MVCSVQLELGWERQLTPICEMKQRHRGLRAWPRSADQGFRSVERHFQSARSTEQGVRPGRPGMRHAILQGQMVNVLCGFLRSQPECGGRSPTLRSTPPHPPASPAHSSSSRARSQTCIVREVRETKTSASMEDSGYGR